MQEALNFQAEDAKNVIERKDGQIDEESLWPTDFIHALQSIDGEADAQFWETHLFTLATVRLGPHKGAQAVGIGSNQNSLKRASNLALAFTVSSMTPGTIPE